MTKDKQIEANRQNALVSTGSRTPEGKTIVAKNAVKHGVFAKELVISDGDGKESKEDFDRLFQQLVDDLQPEGQMEILLVEKIAVNYWRLKRLVRYETGEIRDQLDGFKQKAVDKYYDNVMDYPLGKAPHKPLMEYYDYNDEVTEEEIKEQAERIVKMAERDYDWLKDKEFQEYLKESYSADEIKAFSKNKLAREKTHYLREQKQILEEMREVWVWQKKFDIIVRTKALPESYSLDKINKYEASLERSIFRNLGVLKQLQQVRLRSGN